MSINQRAVRVIVVVLATLAATAAAAPARATTLTTPALLDTLQRAAFDFFWNEANPANGLIKDRSASWSPCSIASTGFGLTAICIGIDHGWISREEGRARVLTTLGTFWNGSQGAAASGVIGYQGFFYHFLDMTTATRTWDCELSSVDTAWLLTGMLDCREYFDTDEPLDVEVRALVDNIYNRVNWEFMRDGGIALKMGWLPGTGFANFGYWIGYNEAMALYILALGSPTYPIPTTCWNVWVSGYQWASYYGQEYVIFPPLFGHQYSHCWIDFRYLQDSYMRYRGITYHENSRRATYAAQAYCVANPGGFLGYGPDWGLTASDDPVVGYQAHGAPPPMNDNGTITPTAAAASIAFAPEIVVPTLHHWFDDYRGWLWGPYGFKDAFNLSRGWWSPDVIGIDQGPIILMIENYLNRAVWARFMRNAAIQTGLARAGFTRTVGVAAGPGEQPPRIGLAQNSPNPFRGRAKVALELTADGPARLGLYDLRGRRVRKFVDSHLVAGKHVIEIDGQGLPSGIYFLRLEACGQKTGRRCAILD